MTSCGRSTEPMGDAAGTHRLHEDQQRRVARETERPPGPLAAPGPGSKVQAAARTPQPPSPGPLAGIPDPTFARRGPETLGEENLQAGGTCLLLSGLSPGRREQPRHLGKSTHPRALRDTSGPAGLGSLNFVFLVPHPHHTMGPRNSQLEDRPTASAHPPWDPGATAVARLLGSRAPLRPLQGPPPAASPPLATALSHILRTSWRGCVT